MKYPILFCFLIFACETNTQMESQLITVSQTTQGFDVYSNDGELILEFTIRNCDSLSLETLAYIFESPKEFNVDPKKFKELYKDKPKNYIVTLR